MNDQYPDHPIPPDEISLAMLLQRWTACTSPTWQRHLSEVGLHSALQNEENQ